MLIKRKNPVETGRKTLAAKTKKSYVISKYLDDI
jgi:hypothetical protein